MISFGPDATIPFSYRKILTEANEGNKDFQPEHQKETSVPSLSSSLRFDPGKIIREIPFLEAAHGSLPDRNIQKSQIT
jgi:hypothetical protein